jgi:hypothetical protein
MDPIDGTNQDDTSVEDDLQSGSDTNSVADSINIHKPEAKEETKRIVRKKTPDEVRFLENEFAKDPKWTRRTVQI